jgi:hypothetical protein
LNLAQCAFHKSTHPRLSIPSSYTLLHSRLLLATTPDPLLIFLPLRLDIPESFPALSLPTRLAFSKTSVQSQERVRIALTQYRFAFLRVLALWMLTLARYLTRPLRILDGAQRLCRHDDASGKEEDGEEELEGYVGGEWGGCESGGVLVGGVDAVLI